ncbi:MAG: DUF1679 domain-containing protein [Gammaproteobacteria bacterium]|nr:MAG: DUF1679 domain-containing protein [Gammaproteobacteria bacterium]
MEKASTGPGICASPQAVTRAWLEAVLHSGGYDVSVAGFTAQAVGTGQVGQNIRFVIEYRRGEGPRSLVGKFASDDPESRQTGIALSNYLREVRFYQELQPTLDIQTPVVLFTDIDLDTQDFVLMMEDLAPAVQGDQISGCDPAAAALAMRELGKLHGPRWDDHALREIPWLSAQNDESAAMVLGLWNSVFPGFKVRYANHLRPEHRKLLDALAERFDRYVAPRSTPATVTHGDYRLDNMLFGGPYPLTVVDWQSPGLGNGTADAAYFMGTSFDQAAERRECERDLLDAYYETLLGYGIAGYTQDDCWRDYVRASVAGLVMAVIASMIVGQTPRGDEMFMAMARRSAEMALDLGAIDSL